MNALLAVLKDSWDEAVERRALFVVGLLGLVAIVFCLGVSFEERDPAVLFREQVQNLGDFSRSRGNSQMVTSNGFEIELPVAARPVEASDGWPASLDGGWHLRAVLGRPGSLAELSQRWQNFWDLPMEEALPPLEWVGEKLRQQGWDATEARWVDETKGSLEVAVRTADLARVEGAYTRNLFFGAVSRPLRGESRGEAILEIQVMLAQGLVGFLGMLVALLVCSGFVPALLQKGTLDLSLARPIGRVRLLLYKYLGGLWFLLIMAALIIGGTFLALLLRTGVAEPRYLVLIPVLLVVFAVFYTVEVLVGVLTRSANIAGMAGVAAWWGSWIFVTLYDANRGFAYLGDGIRVPLKALYTALPKTTHLTDQAVRWIAEAQVGAERAQRFFETEVDWAFSGGTTLAFAAVLLGFACWRFRQTDY